MGGTIGAEQSSIYFSPFFHLFLNPNNVNKETLRNAIMSSNIRRMLKTPKKNCFRPCIFKEPQPKALVTLVNIHKFNCTGTYISVTVGPTYVASHCILAGRLFYVELPGRVGETEKRKKKHKQTLQAKIFKN